MDAPNSTDNKSRSSEEQLSSDALRDDENTTRKDIPEHPTLTPVFSPQTVSDYADAMEVGATPQSLHELDRPAPNPILVPQCQTNTTQQFQAQLPRPTINEDEGDCWGNLTEVQKMFFPHQTNYPPQWYQPQLPQPVQEAGGHENQRTTLFPRHIYYPSRGFQPQQLPQPTINKDRASCRGKRMVIKQIFPRQTNYPPQRFQPQLPQPVQEAGGHQKQRSMLFPCQTYYPEQRFQSLGRQPPSVHSSTASTSASGSSYDRHTKDKSLLSMSSRPCTGNNIPPNDSRIEIRTFANKNLPYFDLAHQVSPLRQLLKPKSSPQSPACQSGTTATADNVASLGISYESKKNKKMKPMLKCDACGVAFFGEHFYKEHICTHWKAHPFQCKRCGEDFLNSIHLMLHNMNEEHSANMK